MIRLVIHDPNVPLLLLMYLFLSVFLSERILDVTVADFVFFLVSVCLARGKLRHDTMLILFCLYL